MSAPKIIVPRRNGRPMVERALFAYSLLPWVQEMARKEQRREARQLAVAVRRTLEDRPEMVLSPHLAASFRQILDRDPGPWCGRLRRQLFLEVFR